ncbi:SRPBCC family protein [Spirillospora sp. NBC_01491]|nr:SRPBCC family protein [Spirillospora sp. NBC_01491]
MTDIDDKPRTPTDLPIDQLKEAGQDVVQALMVKALQSATGKVQGLTERLTDSNGDSGTGTKAAVSGAKELAKGKSPLKAGLHAGMTGAKDKAKGALSPGGDKGGGGGNTGSSNAKVINIVEEFDVGLPLRVTYDQWTRFADYPKFTSKVETVEQESDEKLTWRARIFMSHRSWQATIVEQVPDDRIVWKSEGDKGYVDGAVTFHEIAPTLTRVLLVAEYHPDGFVEKTANLWRAQGRRLRLDFKHIKRHMMTQAILEQGETEGWRGEIRDSEVVKTHDDAVKEEEEKKKADEGSDSKDRAEDGPKDRAESEGRAGDGPEDRSQDGDSGKPDAD